ncbi:hypothetical protein BC835DRAFT_675392 [Cytidiella melzeri]|nr:hypothetical protein BC835DRAFT_675392 [Cytidiella melzeri]
MLEKLNPCPIAYCSSWMSIEQSLWFVDAEQASAFPSKKEGKKANNGMLLRKRKAGAAAHVTFNSLAGVVVEGVTDSGRPKKRVRTSPRERKGKTSDAAQIHEASGEMLEELSLPGVVVSLDRPSSSSSSTAFSFSSIHSGTPTKETKLQLMGVDAPLAPSITASPTSASVAQLSAPEPKRRSVRQAHKRGDTSTPSSAALNIDLSLHTPTSDIMSLTNTPSVQDSALPAGQEQDGSRPVITRARSSSSSCASAVTVVSNALSATTVVDEEASEKSKEVDKEVGMEKEGKLRTSGRARKSAAKKVEAEVAEKVGSAPRKGRARQRTVGRK